MLSLSRRVVLGGIILVAIGGVHGEDKPVLKLAQLEQDHAQLEHELVELSVQYENASDEHWRDAVRDFPEKNAARFEGED